MFLFTGEFVLNPLVEPGRCPVFAVNVTLGPGCRNNRHMRRTTKGGGQILICTAGEGWYQEEGREAVSDGEYQSLWLCVCAER